MPPKFPPSLWAPHNQPSTYRSSSFLQAPLTLPSPEPTVSQDLGSPFTQNPLGGGRPKECGMSCVSLSLCCPTLGTCSVGYAGGVDRRGQVRNLDGTMGDLQVSLLWCLQGSYLGALGTRPWSPHFTVAREACHSPALLALSTGRLRRGAGGHFRTGGLRGTRCPRASRGGASG